MLLKHPSAKELLYNHSFQSNIGTQYFLLIHLKIFSLGTFQIHIALSYTALAAAVNTIRVLDIIKSKQTVRTEK
jgi:hypothetical protein